MNQLSQRQVIIAAAVMGIFLVFGIFIFINLQRTNSTSGKANITVWGFDPQSDFQDLGSAYAQFRSGASITYTQIPADGYHEKILTALASGKGPDVFMIGNHDLPQLQSVLAVAPSSVSLVDYENNFPQVAVDDFVSGGEIYAFPLYLDTLAAIYNRDLVNNAAIAVFPSTWNGFAAAIPALRVLDNGTLTRSAAALGGTEQTVDNGVDLLFLLMMQNGAQMIDPTTRAFASFAEDQGTGENPGIAAFNFYLQFANPASSLYTWDESKGENSLDDFAGGKTAVIFDYKQTLSAIKAKSPFLNTGVAPVPQTAGAAARVDYAKYAGLAVSKASPNQAYAWDFISFATANPTGVAAYLKASGEPSAYRPAIAEEESDPDLSVFARQALTARSWYEVDDARVHSIMNSAISAVLSGQTDPRTALNQAQSQVTQVITSK